MLPVISLRIVPRSAGEHELGSDSWLHRMPRRVQLSTPNILKALVSDSSRNAALGNGFSIIFKLPMRPPESRTRNSSDKSQSLRSNRLSLAMIEIEEDHYRITGILGHCRGQFMESLWKIHVHFMENSCKIHGNDFAIFRNSWEIHGNS